MKGSEFRTLRDRAKLTQLQAALALGVTPNTVHRWESLETVPRLVELAFSNLTREAAAHETEQEKAARELAQRKSTEAAWAALPPWDDNERARRQRLGLPMNDVNEPDKRLADLEAKMPGIFGENNFPDPID